MQTDAPVQGLRANCFQADSVSTYSLISFRTSKNCPVACCRTRRRDGSTHSFNDTTLRVDKSPVSTIYFTVSAPFSTTPQLFPLFLRFLPNTFTFLPSNPKVAPHEDGFLCRFHRAQSSMTLNQAASCLRFGTLSKNARPCAAPGTELHLREHILALSLHRLDLHSETIPPRHYPSTNRSASISRRLRRRTQGPHGHTRPLPQGSLHPTRRDTRQQSR